MPHAVKYLYLSVIYPIRQQSINTYINIFCKEYNV